MGPWTRAAGVSARCVQNVDGRPVEPTGARYRLVKPRLDGIVERFETGQGPDRLDQYADGVDQRHDAYRDGVPSTSGATSMRRPSRTPATSASWRRASVVAYRLLAEGFTTPGSTAWGKSCTG
jgi:hypothetical protein